MLRCIEYAPVGIGPGFFFFEGGILALTIMSPGAK